VYLDQLRAGAASHEHIDVLPAPVPLAEADELDPLACICVECRCERCSV
jgi:hypothetical protein